MASYDAVLSFKLSPYGCKETQSKNDTAYPSIETEKEGRLMSHYLDLKLYMLRGLQNNA